MTIILVLLCIFTSSIQSVLRRGYDDRVRGGGVAFFGAVQSFVSLLVFVAAGAVRGYDFPSEPAMYLYSFGFAAFYGTSISATQAAFAHGPYGLTSLITSYAPVIPAVYGILVLGEPVNPTKVAGLACFIVSLPLMRSAKADEKDSERPANRKWLVFVIVSLVCNGFCSVTQKAEQNTLGGVFANEFMIVALSLVTIGLSAAAVVREKDRISAHAISFPILCGAANGATNKLVLIVIASAAASVFFPMISAGQLVASVVYSIVIYREKLSVRQYIAAALGIASLVLLSI